MKIVINDKFGGEFELSNAAIRRLDEIGGQVKRMSPKDYYAGNPDWEGLYRRCKENNLYATGYNEDGSEYILWDNYSNANEDNLREMRSCPKLVQAIEELGMRANSVHSDLHVVEIPDDIQWHICNQDGREWIAERHRKWFAKTPGEDGDSEEFRIEHATR